MNDKVFIIPGFYGSGAAHWQSWLETQLSGCVRLRDVDWARPDLSTWVDQAQAQLQALPSRTWLVAHSFGCLVAATLAAVAPEKIAGIVFVAPAEPRRFAIGGGLRNTRFDRSAREEPSIVEILPHALPQGIRSVVIASENDPWLAFPDAEAMAARWCSTFVNLGEAGHVNVDAGYGPWPGLLQQVENLRREGADAFARCHRAALARATVVDEPLHRGAACNHATRHGAVPRFAF